MKGVLSKILRLAFAVLLIINTIPRNLYADEGDVAIPEPEPIVETAPEPEPEPEPAPTPEPVSEAQPNAPPAEPAPAPEPEPAPEVKQEEAEPVNQEEVSELTEELPAEEADGEELPASETADSSDALNADDNKEDAVVEAEMEQISYTIYFEASENGLVLVDGIDPASSKAKQEVKAKEELKAVKAEANEGYEFEEWQLNGVSFSKEATLKADQIELKDEDRYTALFKEIVEETEGEIAEESEIIEETEEAGEEELTKVQIFFEASEHGTISAEGFENVPSLIQEAEKAEELVSVSANADEGYEFAEWQKNGEHFSDEATLEASGIELKNEDKYVAVFKEAEAEEVIVEEIVEEEANPAGEFSKVVSGMIVKVAYEKDTFPKGTEMVVTPIAADEIYDIVNNATEGEVKRIKAVDITFWYEGKEIQPEKAVSVYMKAYGYDDAKEQQVVHIDDKNNVETVSGASSSGGAAESEFAADHFSIYAIVETGDDARLTVEFKNGDSVIASQIVKKSDIDSGIFDQIVYDPGAGSIDSDQVFRGWTHVKDYTVEGLTDGTNPSMTIDAVREDVKAILNEGVHDGDTVTYYAMVFHVINVTYKDEDNVVIKNEGLLTKGETVNYTVNETYVPKTADQEFQGWNFTTSGTITKADGSPIEEGETILNETEIIISNDLILTVKAPSGYWLIFKENAKGASYTSPQFLEGEKPTVPADPTRFGYTFGGWYTDEACTDGNEFNFDQVLKKTTTVYAKWIEVETADYVIIIWKQNVKGNGYDFTESIKGEGIVGETINDVTAIGSGNSRYASIKGTAYRWEGFYLEDFDTNVVVNTNGTAAVNVYYNRVTITLTFQYRQNNI